MEFAEYRAIRTRAKMCTTLWSKHAFQILYMLAIFHTKIFSFIYLWLI
jgi:hypothetical protein